MLKAFLFQNYELSSLLTSSKNLATISFSLFVKDVFDFVLVSKLCVSLNFVRSILGCSALLSAHFLNIELVGFFKPLGLPWFSFLCVFSLLKEFLSDFTHFLPGPRTFSCFLVDLSYKPHSKLTKSEYVWIYQSVTGCGNLSIDIYIVVD